MPQPSPTIAVSARSVATDFDPWSLVRTLPARWRPILLDSGGDVERARWSIWAAKPTRVHSVRAAELLPLSRTERLRRLFGPLDESHGEWSIAGAAANDLDDVPFLGGWLGWVTYEAGVLCAPRTIAPRAPFGSGEVLRFGFYPRGFAHDRLRHRVMRFELRGDVHRGGAAEPARTRVPPPAPPSEEEARFTERVARAKELIASGEIYQVNLSAELERRAGIDARRLYGVLRALSPAPYGAFACDPSGALLCNSPELHFRTRGERWIAQPIKGTRARSEDEERDRAIQSELLASEKDRAELVMIVDLYRNDLGRLAAPGTVRVEGGIALRSFGRVHHLMADVVARSAKRVDPAAAFEALFPAGSITGAPKQRAMEIVRDLEERERGIYCGAVGAVDVRGEMMFNVAIRSAAVARGELRLRMGAGIVADSDPESELAEIRAKAASWREALARCAAVSSSDRRARWTRRSAM